MLRKNEVKEHEQRQIEITEPTRLLTEEGYVNRPGWCRHNLFIYNREDISAPKIRIKEWDFYQVTDGRFLIQLTMGNISVGAGATVLIKDMKDSGKVLLNTGLIRLFTINRYEMPRNAQEPCHIEMKSKIPGLFKMYFDYDGKIRHLYAEGRALQPFMKSFKLDLKLHVMEDLESITIAIPWKKKDDKGCFKDHFFLTDKINSMPADGFFEVGNRQVNFNRDKTLGVLDWGRGVWRYDINWFWGNGGGYLPDGNLFGYEVTYGFGDDSDATETCAFYNGKAHKLGRVTIDYDKEDPLSRPWTFHEENGRFEMELVPEYNNKKNTDIGILCFKGDQVHGKMNGHMTLDDGRVIEVSDVQTFCEFFHNKW